MKDIICIVSDYFYPPVTGGIEKLASDLATSVGSLNKHMLRSARQKHS